jgi:hypothetical protein
MTASRTKAAMQMIVALSLSVRSGLKFHKLLCTAALPCYLQRAET